MADVDLMYGGGGAPGFDFAEEFRRRVPTGGVTGGTPLDPASPNFSNPTPQPTAGGFDYNKLNAWRDLGRRSGFRVDETDLNVFNDPRFQAWQIGGAVPQSLMPDQFDDPYTKQLEGIAKAQMGQVRSNPGLDQLTAFLQKQFGELSSAPGFSPDELAVLRTQALEPIEELRNASKKRALERTSMRGMLPSSGLNELDMRDIDIAADKSRAAAGRDLAINAIDRRDADLSRAGQIASQLGLQIPGQQRSEELALASLLYDLPRKALQDALAVTQGSPTANDLFSQAVRLAQTNQQNQLMNQNKWAQLAQLLAGLDF